MAVKTKTVELAVERIIERLDVLILATSDLALTPRDTGLQAEHDKAKAALTEAFIQLLMLVEIID